MIETIVSAALHAVIISVILGALLGVLVLVIVRSLALSATARHALWTIALIATAVMPLAGLGVSGLRALAVPTILPAATMRAAGTARSSVVKQFPHQPATLSASRTNANLDPLAHLPTQLPAISAFPWDVRLTHAVALGIVVVWLAGASLGMATLFFSIARVRALKKNSSPLEGELASDLPWLTENRASEREIYLRLSHEIETPVAVGFRRPVILIPTELIAVDGLRGIEELVMHEHAHLRRYDDWTNLAQRTIERLFWFNPLVWIVGRRIALEREIAADDAVVAQTGEAQHYAQSLWRLAREMRMPEHAIVAPGALFTRKQITIRIESLIAARKTIPSLGPAAAAGIGAASVLCVALIATSAPALELPAAQPVSPQTSPPVQTKQTAKRKTPGTVKVTRIKPANVDHAGAHLAALDVHVPAMTVHIPATTVHVPKIDVPLPAVHETTRQIHDISRRIASLTSATVMTQALAQAESSNDAHGLAGAELAKVLRHCDGCDLAGSDLRNADLRNTKLIGADLAHADLRGAILDGAQWSGVDLEHARLDGASLVNATFTGVDIQGISLAGAHTDGLRMIGVSLGGMDLHGLNVRALLAGCTGCDLAGADLHDLDLHNIRFLGTDLVKANLRGANLSGAQFTGADLEGADLRGARLDGTSFTGADIKGIIMR
jgi:uncharacterized protein YjbI with pentapeptide repeats/beta-lactamase regulating signal transducer with metallopeptidase domain